MQLSRGPLALALVFLALAGTVTRAQTLAPPGWDAAVKLNELVDSNPDPGVVEIELTATLADVRIAGTTVKAWTYNGSVPGPLIRTKVGDRVIVHFRNELAEPTTVHWHGVRVPIEMDGVPGISQPAVTHGRELHLRLRGQGRRPVLVSPARDVGGRRWATASTARCSSRIRPTASASTTS